MRDTAYYLDIIGALLVLWSVLFGIANFVVSFIGTHVVHGWLYATVATIVGLGVCFTSLLYRTAGNAE